MAGDKRKGKEPAIEPRKKSKVEKEAERARAAAVVAERRLRRPDPPFRIREPAPAQQKEPEQQTEAEQAETGAAEPEAEQQQQGPRRSGRTRTQAVPAGALAAPAEPEETPVRQGPRTRGGRMSHVTPAGRPRPQRPTAEQTVEERAAARAIYQMDHTVRVEQGTMLIDLSKAKAQRIKRLRWDVFLHDWFPPAKDSRVDGRF